MLSLMLIENEPFTTILLQQQLLATRSLTLTNHWMSSHSLMPSPVCASGNDTSCGAAAAAQLEKARQLRLAFESRRLLPKTRFPRLNLCWCDGLT
jgi:hypothetical protein